MNLSFDDVLILPNFSTVKSRADVNTSTSLALETLILPVISSNMSCVTGDNMSEAMLKHGGQACLPRFMSIEDNVKLLHSSVYPKNVIKETDIVRRPWVSVGLGTKELERAEALYSNGASTLVIDVAHGASMSVVNQVKNLRHIIKDNSRIIVGNFATGQSVKDFKYHLGGVQIEAIKSGVGGGGACSTRIVTGCGMPTFSSIVDCRSAGIPIIADGGIRTSGDFAKALAAGASAVMLGKMLAGSDESASIELYDSEGYIALYPKEYNQTNLYKKYYGSASLEAYKEQGKEAYHRTPEGGSFLIPYTGPVKNTLQQLEAGLRSSMSYVGAYDLREFQQKATFAEISNAGIIESGLHGKNG